MNPHDLWVPCYPDCEDWWIILVEGKIVTTCKESWGAGSCRDSPANKMRLTLSDEEKRNESKRLC